MGETNRTLINKVRRLKDKYYNLSLCFHELIVILEIKDKRNEPTKELKKILKGLDFNKIEDLSKCSLKDLMKGGLN